MENADRDVPASLRRSAERDAVVDARVKIPPADRPDLGLAREIRHAFLRVIDGGA